MPERIVVTGMGTVNPLGLSVSESWGNALAGKSGVGPISLFDASNLDVRIACEVKNFDPQDYLSSREARRRDRFEQLAVAAAQEAHKQAELDIEQLDVGRVGVLVGSAIGGIKSTSEGVLTLHDQGPRRISPLTIPMLMINGAAGMISIDYGYRGPSFSVVSACATGIDSIGVGWLMLRAGILDVAIVGAADATITDIGIATFDRIGAMSHRSDGFDTPKPFDLERDGLVMGEGAAVLILERESWAISRGAEILCELAGYAGTADAYHVTAPREDGAGGAEAISQALKAAQANQDEVDFISAHGTATELNDLTETRAIKKAFGDYAYQIPVSATKSMTGHMMGATGALETIFCIQSIRNRAIPPTINYSTPDPECDLDYVPNTARDHRVRVAVNNAFGFGGHNAVLVLRAYE